MVFHKKKKIKRFYLIICGLISLLILLYNCFISESINKEVVYPSLFIPTIETPQIQKLDDGYSWFPVFRVDLSHYNFLSKTDLPIPQIRINNDYNTFSDKYKSLCSSGVTSFGTCCLYFKEAGYDDISGITYVKGQLSNENVFSTCYDCQKLGDALKREARFSKLTGTKLFTSFSELLSSVIKVEYLSSSLISLYI